jgi:hypothetical protein
VPETFTPRPTPWVNGSSGGTPITAEELNRLEAGIESMDDRVTALEDTAAVVTANPQTTAYTLALADAGKLIEMNSGAALTLTVPPNSSTAYPVGTVIEVSRMGTGSVTLVAGVGVTLRVPAGSTLALRAQYSTAGLRKRAADEWIVSGDLA